jgi:uncharacterized protein YciI
MNRTVLLLVCGIFVTVFALKPFFPEVVGQTKPTNAQKPKVFAAIYERGSAYQKAKNIFEQPTIKEHIAHHEALGNKLIAAGPLKALSEDKTVGIIVFEAESEEKAQQWLRQDPAVIGKVLNASVGQWGVSGVREFRQR